MGNVVANNQEQVARSVLAKMTGEDARNYLNSGEFPAVELTAQEMEFLKAGAKLPSVKEWFEGLIKEIFGLN